MDLNYLSIKSHLPRRFLRASFIFLSFFPLLIASLFSPGISHASLLWSQTSGPYGAYAYSLAVSPSDPNVIYLGTEWSGIYVSSNSGESWSVKNNGLLNLSVKINDIAVNPYNPNIAYVVTDGTGLARTASRGDTWEPKNNNLGSSVIYGVDIDPRKPSNIYAATYSGVKKSTDEGGSWAGGGLEGLGEITSIRIVSSESYSVIYAGTAGSGVWRSTNEALSWTNILSNEVVTALGVSRSSPEAYVYAGVKRGGLYKITRTNNGGATWVDTNYNNGNASSISWKVNFIAVHPSSPEVAFAAPGALFLPNGVYKTTNEVTWIKKLPDPNTNFTFLDVAFNPVDPSKIYTCGIGGGFYISTNEGESWILSNSGINNALIGALLVASGESGSIVFAGTQLAGIFRSTSAGVSWEEVNKGISLGRRVVYSLAQDPLSKEVIYAGTADMGGTSGTIYRSLDYGLTWEAKLSLGGVPNAIAVDPISHEVVYAGTSASPYFYRSPDSGGTWEAWADGLPADQVRRIIVTSFGGKSYIHIGGIPPLTGGAWRRLSDGSTTWEFVSGGIGGTEIRYFAPNYATPEAIYAGASAFIYSKTVEATAWDRKVQLPDATISHLAADPGTPSTIYGSNFRRGIFKILDFGSSYIREEMGLEVTRPTDNAKPLAIDIYANPRTLYAEVNGRSVWSSIVLGGNIPDKPVNLNGQPLSSGSIKWTWTDNSYIEDGFRLKQGLTNVATLGVNVSQYTETGLSTNTAYSRIVVAFNANGEGLPSDAAQRFTLANIPGVPGSKEVGRQNITITWEANTNPSYTSYEVYRSTTEVGSGLPIYWQYVSTAGTTEYPDTGLTFETTYYYRVRALNGNGIPTIFMTSEGFVTGPPIPSDDVIPPVITRVRFDGRQHFDNDIIYHTPRITAIITDRASTEAPYFVTPEGVDSSSVRMRFDDYVFNVSPLNVSQIGGGTIPITVEVNYTVPARLGSTSYIVSIEATDRAFPWYNRTIWTGRVRVMGERPSIVGEPVAYPMPFSPQRDKITTMSYTLSTNADVTIYMYDISGKIILTKKFSSGGAGGKAGYNQFTWNGITDFGKVAGNGIYIYKIISNGKAIGTGKMVVLD